MRILVVGAGAVGGYFGGRLLQHGRDVTFLVREGRAASLARTGLAIRSAAGDATLSTPPTVVAREIDSTWDLVLLSCKAYDLAQAMDDIAPAVGAQTTILPLLNGMRHLDLLDARFGPAQVLGGRCIIAATLDEHGAIRHLNRSHSLSFGERDGFNSHRMQQIAEEFANAGFDSHPSNSILQDMWDKWVFLATLAGITCLMRAPVGDIVAAPGGRVATLALFAACCGVASDAGHAPSQSTLQRARDVLMEPDSRLTASMLRDLQNGHAIEADHIIGDLITRGGKLDESSLLRVVYAHLKAYEAGRTRRQAG